MKITLVYLLIFSTLSLAALGESEHNENEQKSVKTEVQQNEVSYLIDISLNEEFHCNGVLIRKKFVLTAASCLLNANGDAYPKESFKFYAGESGHEKVDEVHRTDCMQNVTSHPNYTRNTRNGAVKNDIAVIQLKKGFQLPEEIQVARLAHDHERSPDEALELKLVGKNRCPDIDSSDNCTSNTLSMFTLQLDQEGQKCGSYDLNFIQNTQKPLDYCLKNHHLYSGSPSIDQYGSGKVLFGIQSVACDPKSCVHTKVGPYIYWIESLIGKEEKKTSERKKVETSGSHWKIPVTVFAIVGFVVVIFIVLLCCWKKRNNKGSPVSQEDDDQLASGIRMNQVAIKN